MEEWYATGVDVGDSKNANGDQRDGRVWILYVFTARLEQLTEVALYLTGTRNTCKQAFVLAQRM